MPGSKKVNNQPQEITDYPEIDQNDQNAIECINEIFMSPLTGSYNWDYIVVEDRIKKLYELGKELNWNVSSDLDWSQDYPKDKLMINYELFQTPESVLKGYDDLSDEKKVEMDRHRVSWNISQFLHGEQGALLVASQLVSCAPTFNAKMYAASQTFDEARHVESFNRYVQSRMELMYPIGNALKSILDKILTDPRWDLKFIGMQIIIEGLALAAFERQRVAAMDPLLKDIFYLVIRDEARHVTFGVNYLEEFVQTLSDEEKEDRAEFAYEACVVMRNRFGSDNVMNHYGWDVEEAQKVLNQSESSRLFNNLLFSKIMPNLKRIGLLTEKTQEKYEEMDILQFQDLEDDKVIDWDEMSKPLEYSSKTA